MHTLDSLHSIFPSVSPSLAHWHTHTHTQVKQELIITMWSLNVFTYSLIKSIHTSIGMKLLDIHLHCSMNALFTSLLIKFILYSLWLTCLVSFLLRIIVVVVVVFISCKKQWLISDRFFSWWFCYLCLFLHLFTLLMQPREAVVVREICDHCHRLILRHSKHFFFSLLCVFQTKDELILRDCPTNQSNLIPSFLFFYSDSTSFTFLFSRVHLIIILLVSSISGQRESPYLFSCLCESLVSIFSRPLDSIENV